MIRGRPLPVRSCAWLIVNPNASYGSSLGWLGCDAPVLIVTSRFAAVVIPRSSKSPGR